MFEPKWFVPLTIEALKEVFLGLKGVEKAPTPLKFDLLSVC